MAIATASQQPNLKSVAIRNLEQQALQPISRVRQHLTDNQTAVSNTIWGLLSEFGLVINKGEKAGIGGILEDTENGLPDILRPLVNDMYPLFFIGEAHLKQVSRQLESFINQQEQCNAKN